MDSILATALKMKIPSGPVPEDRKLVQEIRKHATLYQRSQGGRDLNRKQLAWQAVADSLEIEAVDAKNRWRNIRDRFVREKKRLLLDGEQVYRSKDPWPLLEEMSFLWDFTTHRANDPTLQPIVQSPTNEPVPVVSRKRKRTPMEVRLQPILPRPSPEWVNVGLEFDPAPTCTLTEGGSTTTSIKQEMDETGHLSSLIEKEEEESGELEGDERLFCSSVAAAFKRFTPKMRALAKWRIQQVLYEVEFEAAQ